jgi:hypothetical protein
MMDRHFGDSKAGLLNLSHQLDADHTTVFLQPDPIEHVSADQAEVAVDVADVQSEHRPDGPVVELANDDSLDRIVSLDLVALDDVDIVAKRLDQFLELSRVVLGVAVGVADQLLGRAGETAA